MKPDDGLHKLGSQLIYQGDVEVKTEVDELISSPASDALQLIFQDTHVDPNSIMLDLTAMLRRDPTLSSLNPPARSQQQVVQGVVANPGVPIPKRSQQVSNNLLHQSVGDYIELEDMSAPNTMTPSMSSSFGAFGAGSSTLGSSYGASPLAPTSPSLWEPVPQVKKEVLLVKQEDLDQMSQGPGLCLSGGQISPQESQQQMYTTLQNAGPTLAQLNSPPNEEHAFLRGISELSDLNVDLDVLMSSDILPQSLYQLPSGAVKVETTTSRYNDQDLTQQIMRGTSAATLSSSSSVPSNMMSHGMADLHVHDLSNLSNGGPALSPNHLTLSPNSRLSLSPNPGQSGTNIQIMSPVPQNRASIIKTTPSTQATISKSATAHSTLHELLMRKEPAVHDPIRSRSNSNQFKAAKTRIAPRQRSSLSASNPLLASQLSKSAPINCAPIERMIWSRREARPHINSVNSVAGDTASIADEVQEALSSLSPSELNDIDSEIEDEGEQSGDSDDELNIDEGDESTPGSSVKKDRHFWQYNVQAKGPKGHKISLHPKIHDPFNLEEVIDPVFSDEIQVHGIKHSGKARRGDGNDLTANPKKLAAIGKELENLGKVINDMAPVSEIPLPTRTKSRKEKNKLASRACRLKKKAQHEANKLKLYGLEEEHGDLLNAIGTVTEVLISKMSRNCEKSQTELTNEAEQCIKKTQKNRVAGFTTDYVNKMIAKHS